MRMMVVMMMMGQMRLVDWQVICLFGFISIFFTVKNIKNCVLDYYEMNDIGSIDDYAFDISFDDIEDKNEMMLQEKDEWEGDKWDDDDGEDDNEDIVTGKQIGRAHV